MRFVIPLILVIAAIGLFVVYTNPTYGQTQNLALQEASYNQTLTQLNGLIATRDSLLATYNAFSPDDISKLQEVLPDDVDNIRLIIDINNIALQHNLSLTDVSLGNVSNSSTAQSSVAVGTSGSPVGSVEVSFSVLANYTDFLAFLQDLEHSLRLVDVDKLTFTTQPGGIDSYTLEIRTYWLH